MSSIKDFVLELQSISDKDVIDIKVPSTGKTCKFKLISVKQHKNTIKCAVDGIEGSIKLSSIFILINVKAALKFVYFSG